MSYAESDYAKALARVASLSPAERQTVVVQLARFTGLPASQIDATRLQVTIDQVSTTLLGQNLMVGRYDSRAVGPSDSIGGPYDPTTDPSLKNIIDGAYVLRVSRGELGYKSDLLYQGPFGGGYPPPATPRGDWMSVRWRNWKGPAAAAALDDAGRDSEVDDRSAGRSAEVPADGFAAAMASDADLRVFVASGYFDLVGECYATDYAARHLPSAIATRVTSHVYAGGHATYTDDEARRQLHADVVQFFQAGAHR